MPPRRIALVVAALLAAQLLLVAAFVVPGRDPEPQGLPIGVAGPPAAVAPVERALAPRGDAFELHRYAGVEQARAAIREREVYGVVAATEGQLLVASAASPVVAQLLEQSIGRGVQVEDVVPLAEGDPRGAALNLMFLPLIVICIPLVFALAGLRPLPMLAAIAGFAALSGLLVAAVVGEGMDALPGSYLAAAGVLALIVLAIALPMAGLTRLLGPPGIGIAALLFVAIGNPGSGNASAPELLPGFWRVAGQLLPPGAGGQALKDVAYFDGNALTEPLLVLLAWALGGAALLLLARRRRRVPEPAEPRVAVAA